MFVHKTDNLMFQSFKEVMFIHVRDTLRDLKFERRPNGYWEHPRLAPLPEEVVFSYAFYVGCNVRTVSSFKSGFGVKIKLYIKKVNL